jgi:hypothetical protein
MPYYEDWEYEEDGNHGNGRYDLEYEHESYSGHSEPDQYVVLPQFELVFLLTCPIK